MGLYGREGRDISRPATGFREQGRKGVVVNLSFLCLLEWVPPPSGMRKCYGYHCGSSSLAR